VAAVEVCPLEELPPGEMKVVPVSPLVSVGVYNVGGDLCALEDRCSHDDGPLCEGDFDAEEGTVVCPRHGATFDVRTGKALTPPAYQPVATFPVAVVNGIVTVTV